MACRTEGHDHLIGLGSRSEAGFVLPAVVVSILALAIIVAGIVTAGRAAHQTYLAARAETEAKLGLESALAIVQAGLITDPRNWPPRPTPYVLALDGKRFQVQLQAASGLVDLNSSEPRTLEQLFLLAGADLQNAQKLADRIADWRDPDELSRSFGAERDVYVDAGLLPPRNGPFRDVAELTRVLGVTPDLSTCLKPFLTVDSGLPLPQRAFAPEALSALVGKGDTGPILELAIGSAVEVEVQELGSAKHPKLTAVVRSTGAKDQPIITHAFLWGARPDRSLLSRCFK
ncbi:MAG: hypothetical protein CFE32_15985 [Alphaproteobacteria bacterium PA3]|nr:MAG: hypothetical protein CFE32_15985 [Alphaproteobacteria bacterium PA3]